MGAIKKAFPVSNQLPLDPNIGPRAYQDTVDFTTAAQKSYSLSLDMTSGIETVRSVFVDNSNSSAPFFMAIAVTGELIVCPPYSQGFFPVLFPKSSNFQATLRSSGLTTVSFQLLNFDSDLNIWNVTTPLSAGVQQVQGSVTVSPLSAAWINRSGAIASGGTSQILMPANGARKRLYIRNPGTTNGQINAGATLETLYFNFTNGSGVEDGVSFELLPGETYDTGLGPLSTEAMTITAATTGHRYIARELQ